MCGRTACTLPPDDVRKACTYRDGNGKRCCPEWKGGDADKYSPSYNRAPQSNSPVLVSGRHFDKDTDTSERVIAAMRWGLIPSWFRESDPSKMQYSTSNCRSDTMLEKTLYKAPLAKGKRCVVLADGFYEWKRENGNKQPYYIYFPQIKEEKCDEEDDGTDWKGCRLLTMAGVFDCWEPPNGEEPLYSYSIITVDASEGVKFIHHRMPAILDGEEAIQKWLDFGEVPVEEALKCIHPIENVSCHPVSSIVNNSRNNTPECMVPVDLTIKKEPVVSASSKKMMSWLKSKSPKKEVFSSPNPTEQSPKKETPKQETPPKKSSAGLMQKWLKKEEHEPSPKRIKMN